MRSSNGNVFCVLALCEGNPPVTGGFPSQRPVMRMLDVFVDVRLNNDWANSQNAGELRRHGAHCVVSVMRNLNRAKSCLPKTCYSIAQSFWNSAQGMAAVLPCSAQTFQSDLTNEMVVAHNLDFVRFQFMMNVARVSCTITALRLCRLYLEMYMVIKHRGVLFRIICT